jgi:hypothetical protein
VQQRGGMWAGSVTDIVKIRFRQLWHMRCPQESLAVLRYKMSSVPQVRQDTLEIVRRGCGTHMRMGNGMG